MGPRPDLEAKEQQEQAETVPPAPPQEQAAIESPDAQGETAKAPPSREAGPVVSVGSLTKEDEEDKKEKEKPTLPLDGSSSIDVTNEGGVTPVTPGGSTPLRQHVSGVISNTVELAKVMANPRNIRDFIIHVVLLEILAKQLPLALTLALPAIGMDAIVGFVLKPENELHFESAEHRAKLNASFNVHIDFNPGEQEPYVLGTALFGHIGFLLALIGWFSWVLIYIPRCVATKEHWKVATPPRWMVSYGVMMASIPALLYLGGWNAGKVDGGHHYAVFKSISPIIPVLLLLFPVAIWRGRLLNRATNNTLWLMMIMLAVCMACILTVEVVYILGMSGMAPKRKELMVFLYRAILWPILWQVLTVPLSRYSLLVLADGSTSNAIPYLGFALTISSLSSRTVMYGVDSNLFFTILAIEDAVVQCMFNFYHNGQPLMDQLVLKHFWMRFMKLSDTRELARQDTDRARMMRMFWFQSQSVVELTVIFSQAFRTIALYDSRHIFGNMFRPNCESPTSLDVNDLLIKLSISVVMIVAGDLVSSYFVYCKGFPLAEAFRMLLTNKRSWISFGLNNLLGFMLLMMTMIPIMGRTGRCTDFGNGCTCQGLVVYQEICGCCGLSDAELAAQPYDLCRV